MTTSSVAPNDSSGTLQASDPEEAFCDCHEEIVLSRTLLPYISPDKELHVTVQTCDGLDRLELSRFRGGKIQSTLWTKVNNQIAFERDG